MFTPAVLITGGNDAFLPDAEIYHPNRDSPCVLPPLYDDRMGHTQDGSLLCGGGRLGTRRSCRRWNPYTGKWNEVTESLIEGRAGHISWTPADGSVTFLMGGLMSQNTSEVINNDNHATASFPLQHGIV